MPDPVGSREGLAILPDSRLSRFSRLILKIGMGKKARRFAVIGGMFPIIPIILILNNYYY